MRGRSRRALALVVALCALLAALYGLLLPLGEAPDEPGHYNYARILALEQRLPRGDEEHEAFQPPLYYWLAAPLARLGDARVLPLKANADFDIVNGPGNLLLHDRSESFPWAGWATGWHLVRLLSTALGAVTAYALYRLGYLVAGRRVGAAAVTASLMVLAPQFSLLHGAASNDTLALALGSLLLLEAALLARGRVTTRRLVLTGALWGMAVLAKASMLGAGGAVAVALLVPRWRAGRRGWLAAARDLMVVGLACGVICGWWLARNALLYGEPLGWDLINDINQVRRSAVDWPGQVWGLHRSYWLSYVALGLPRWLYVALLVPAILATVGLRRAWRREGALRRYAVVAGTQVLVFAVAWVRWALAVEGTDQARLLYPALAAAAPLAAVGLLAWAPRRREVPVAVAVVALMLAVNVYALVGGVLPVFAPPTRLELAAVPAAAEPVRFGDRLLLVGWRSAEAVAAGGALEVDTWWQAEAPVAEDVWLTLRLVASDGSVPVWKRGSPSAGRDTTDRWPVGPVTYARHRLRLPQDLPAGRYTLEAGLQPFGEDDWLPAGAGGALADIWPLATIEVRAAGASR